MLGPSPRVRGAAPGGSGDRRRPGTIPAGAGSSRAGTSTRRASRDHPRGCGEQARLKVRCRPLPGPSPRVRGAAAPARPRPPRAGTIPAGAGSRLPAHRANAPNWDHPRGCGEQGRSRQRRAEAEGPSPRVRGAGQHARRPDRLRGTIPAGAGSSFNSEWLRGGTGDHPRGCGEQQHRRFRQPQRPGTIPAGAGSSRESSLRRPSSGDHPRGCGEQAGRAPCPSHQGGPSPRVRGAESARRLQAQPAGTIPAGAGSSHHPHLVPQRRRDHPRGCGEQSG